MTWVDPRTFVTDEFMTAAMFNTNIRDNMGEAFREVQLVTVTTDISNGSSWTIGSGTVVATIASRLYTGLECEFRVHVGMGNPATGVAMGLAFTDGTDTHLIGYLPEVRWTMAGVHSLFLSPEGTKTFELRVWGGHIRGTLAPTQVRLLERGGP